MENKSLNSGRMWKNDYKKEGSRQPDWTGKFGECSTEIKDAILQGKELQLAMWTNKPRKEGEKASCSISISLPYVKKTEVVADEEDPF